MSANDEADFSNPPCTTHEPRLESTTEYCARWLATMTAAQPDEPSLFVQEHSPSEVLPQDSVSDIPTSPSSTAGVSRVTRHPIEAHDLPPPATPSSALSRANVTLEPGSEPEIPISTACHEFPCTRPHQASRYEKQPRRKTRLDRYDVSRQHRDGAGVSRRERRERKRERLRSRREVMANFYSAATENRQVLMKPALATGAFVNGRGSISTPLADLTFNELTFPIAQRAVLRATSPQPPNGARKRPSVQVEESPQRTKRQKKVPLVVAQDSPGTRAAQSRQDGATKTNQARLVNQGNDPETPPRKMLRPVNTTPCRAVKYVDCGVDAMSHAAGFAPDPIGLGQGQPPPVDQSSQQANPYAPYYNPLPVYMPEYYAPLYPANGIYPQQGIQPDPDWAGNRVPEYAAQPVDGISMPQEHPFYTDQYIDGAHAQQEYPFHPSQYMDCIAMPPEHRLDASQYVDCIPVPPEHCLEISQYMDGIPMQQEWPDFGHQNRNYGCEDYTVPSADAHHSLATELDEIREEYPAHDPEPQYKADEETKAFWRPNFLR